MGTKVINNRINVKLCYREVNGLTKYHVIVPKGQRFNYRDFINLKDYLKRQFSNNFNRSLYLAGAPRWYEADKSAPEKDQPVFEYFCEKKDIQRAIETFGKMHLEEYTFSFATVSYAFVSELKEVPKDILELSGRSDESWIGKEAYAPEDEFREYLNSQEYQDATYAWAEELPI